MRLRERIVGVGVLVLASAASTEAAQGSVDTVAPVVGLCFLVWILVSALLSAKHPSISPLGLVCWFLLFFPVSIIVFDGNIEMYLLIWYAYIATSLLKTWLMKGWLAPSTRRFLLEWKGFTLLAVTLVTVIAKADLFPCMSGLGRCLHGFTAPEFIYAFGVVSCAVFAVAFLAYYLVTKHS